MKLNDGSMSHPTNERSLCSVSKLNSMIYIFESVPDRNEYPETKNFHESFEFNPDTVMKSKNHIIFKPTVRKSKLNGETFGNDITKVWN